MKVDHAAIERTARGRSESSKGGPIAGRSRVQKLDDTDSTGEHSWTGHQILRHCRIVGDTTPADGQGDVGLG